MSPQKKVKKSEKISQELLQPISQADFKGLSEREINSIGFATWVRQLLQNWRQGTAACKGRAEVSYSNKKPWKQKGTGRARAGSARSPLWRGGGITFGPQPRVRTLKVSKQLKKGVLNSLFWQYLKNNQIAFLDWSLENEKPKTAAALQILKSAGLHDEKINVFLSAQDQLHYASFANLENVRIVFFDEGNAYDLASAGRWIVLKKDLDAFKEMVNSWN